MRMASKGAVAAITGCGVPLLGVVKKIFFTKWVRETWWMIKNMIRLFLMKADELLVAHLPPAEKFVAA